MICSTCQLKIKEDYAIVHYWKSHRPLLLERIRLGKKRSRAQKKIDKWIKR
jgi:hypothetical protein